MAPQSRPPLQSKGSRFRQVNLPQLEFRILGRMLLHAAAVGVAAGVVGSGFFALLELVQRWVLEGAAGYRPLRAFGERAVHGEVSAPFRPWILVFLPALGAAAAGVVALVTRAPEVRGGGGDAMLHAFHHSAGVVRRRV